MQSTAVETAVNREAFADNKVKSRKSCQTTISKWIVTRTRTGTNSQRYDPNLVSQGVFSMRNWARNAYFRRIPARFYLVVTGDWSHLFLSSSAIWTSNCTLSTGWLRLFFLYKKTTKLSGIALLPDQHWSRCHNTKSFAQLFCFWWFSAAVIIILYGSKIKLNSENPSFTNFRQKTT